MSGQPYKYNRDIQKFRQNYMDSLNLRSDLDNANLQANKTYKATGQLPAVSSIPDTRTTAEKFADIEKMKLTIASEMKPIADTNTALEIIQRLINDPTNTDGKLFEFFAQRVKGIVARLEPDYEYGMSGENDISKFIEGIKSMKLTSKSLADTTGRFFLTPGINLSSDSNLQIANDYNALLYAIKDDVGRIVRTQGEKKKSSTVINAFKKAVSLQDDVVQVLVGAFTKINNEILPASDQGTFVLDKKYTEIIKQMELIQNDIGDFNNKSLIITMLDDPIIQLKNGSINGFAEEMTKITKVVLLEDNKMRILWTDVEKLINDFDRTMSALKATRGGGPQPAVPKKKKAGISKKDIVTDAYSNADFLQWITDNNGENFSATKLEDLYNSGAIGQDKVMTYLNAHEQDLYKKENISMGGEPAKLENWDPGTTEAHIYEHGHIKGVGIRRRGRPSGKGISKPFIEKIDVTRGIKASPQYTPFGKYVINNKKIYDNILSIKTIKGTNVLGYPSYKASSHLIKVVKHIIGGGLPSYDDMSKLSEEDKQYLYKLSKKSDILDKLNIPAPSKDQQDKDNHSFEVMRGEIMSGNDNKDLIKKFKILILKMSKQGDLPKSQVAELLSDLAELGY